MFAKIKKTISYVLCALSPKNYVDVINSIDDLTVGEELDKEMMRRSGFDE